MTESALTIPSPRVVVSPKRWFVYLGLLAAAFVWGNVFVGTKYLLQFAPPLHVAALRFFPAGVVFGLYAFVWRRERTWALIRDVRWRIVWFALLGTIVNALALAYGQQGVPSGTASLVVSANPVFTFIFSALFLGERPTARRIVGLMVAFAGVFTIVRWGGGQTVDVPYLLSFVVLLGSPLAWSSFTIMARPVIAKHGASIVTATSTALGAIPLGLVFCDGQFVAEAATFPLTAWGAVALVSLLGVVFTFTVWFAALHHVRPMQAAVVLYFVPAFSVTFSKLLLNEPITLPLIVGGLILIAGVTLINRG